MCSVPVALAPVPPFLGVWRQFSVRWRHARISSIWDRTSANHNTYDWNTDLKCGTSHTRTILYLTHTWRMLVWRDYLTGYGQIPWTARRTNKSVIEEIKATNPLETLIKKQQLSNFGHIMRRENSLEKSIMLGMGGGTRKRGIPRTRWLDDIKAVTKRTLTELCGSARDREVWRKIIMAISRSRTRLDRTG